MRTAIVLAGTVLAALAATVAGLNKSLPFTPETDEAVFVGPAVHIAATGNLNPGWFGHPGATVIYPLALAFRLIAGGDVQAAFASHPQDFYLLGRGLSTAYEVLAIPLVFLVGRSAFGTLAGLIGAWLTAILPIAVAHAQVVRTDSAAVFFGVLSLWLCVRAAQAPTPTRVVLAGLSIGLAIATRYFMLALVPVVLAASMRRAPLALLSVGIGFVVASPFALLDQAALRTSLLAEAETSHIGADGLWPAGNFIWYLTDALPNDLTWPVALLGTVGVGLALWRRQPAQLLVLGYVAIHLVLISASALHWHRWSIQALPLLALFAGFAMQRLVRGPWVVACVVVVSVQLAAQLLLFDLQQLQRSPRLLARDWFAGNVAQGTPIADEWYGPPLGGTGLLSSTRFSLSERPLEEYRGFVVASSAVYDRYFAEPTRYPRQIAFYNALFTGAELRAELRAQAPASELLLALAGAECSCSVHPTRGAPTLRIYAVGPAYAQR